MTPNATTSAEDYIIKTFEHCPIIGLGEGGHHLENSHHFFQEMFDNKNIQDIINVVIVEFANAGYQEFLNRYISGEEVCINDLRKLWRESTQCIGRFGEARIYFELLQKIRNLNFTLPSDKKIIVLGGDPPIDWSMVHSLDNYYEIISKRDSFAAELAIEYGIQRKMNVLMIYSELHLTKITDITRNSQLTITNYVNSKHPCTMSAIAVLDPKEFLLSEETKKWPLYSIADLNKHNIGDLSAENYFTQVFDKDGRAILFKGYKIKEIFDAFLYVGQSESLHRVDFPKSVYSDSEWIELNRRRQILGVKPFDDNLR